MKHTADQNRKKDNSELPDQNDRINLKEEDENFHDDNEIIVLHEEVQVPSKDNEDIIELTDEVPMMTQKDSTKTPETLDSAIERVIHNLFAEKIDAMIRKAIQKVLAEDIENLRKQILNQHEKKA